MNGRVSAVSDFACEAGLRALGGVGGKWGSIGDHRWGRRFQRRGYGPGHVLQRLHERGGHRMHELGGPKFGLKTFEVREENRRHIWQIHSKLRF